MADAKTCTRCGDVKPLSAFSPGEGTSGVRARCKACVSAAQAAYRKNNAESVRAAEAARKRDPAAARRHTAKWRAANREAVREANRQYRAKSYRAPVRKVDVEAIWTRDKSTCHLCGELVSREVPWPEWMSPSIDHVIPLARGGAHEIENLALAHLGCNQSKGARTA